MVAERNPAISISCFNEKRCGTCIGSISIKFGLLYRFTFSSRNSKSSFCVIFCIFILTKYPKNKIGYVFDKDNRLKVIKSNVVMSKVKRRKLKNLTNKRFNK